MDCFTSKSTKVDATTLTNKQQLFTILFSLIVSCFAIILSVVFEGGAILQWLGLTFALLNLSWIILLSLKGIDFALGLFTGLFITGLVILSGAGGTENPGLGLDLSTVLRVVLLSGTLIIGVWHLPKYYKILSKRPIVWLSIVALLAIFSAVYSADKIYSLALSLSFVSSILYCISISVVMKTENLIKAIFWTLTGLFVISWFLFLVTPDIAVYETILWNGETAWRFEGISNHPNTLGLLLGIYVGILLTMIYKNWYSQYLLIAITILVFFTLLLTESKTALLATVVSGLVLMARMKSNIYYLLVPSVGVVVFVVSFLILNPDIITNLLSSVSRSGNVDEVLTLTGRLSLWVGAFEAIKEAPILGYGYMSTKWVLGTFAPDTWEGMHAHNMLIEGLIFFGLLGTVWLLVIYGDSLVHIMRFKTPMLAFFAPYTFLVGITETSLLSRSIIFVFIFTIALVLSSQYNLPNIVYLRRSQR